MIKDVKMMAKKILYVTLAGVLMLFSSCAEDLVGESVLATEKHFGEEILFGGSASYNVNGGTKNGTRTVYGGYEEGATAEPVYWISTDEVRLYSPEAAVKTADYTVSSADGTQASTGLNKKGDAGLQWGNPTGKHTFYGVYPIPADNSLKEGTTLTGNIPNIQIANKVETSGNITTYQPNMDYAYMVARTEITKPNAIGSEVYMKFTPIATAVEIELTLSSGNNAVELRQVNLTSENHYLSGDFSANLENMTLSTTGDVKYATVCPNNITYGNNVSKSVGISLVDGNNVLTLTAGKTVKFTIFMLPSTNGAADNDAINDLKITLISNSGQQKEGKLNGISIKKSKKTYMHSIPLQGEFTYNQAEWLKYVENSKELNALSIPGAGGASSGNIYNTGVDNYIEQSLSIEDLWKTGIRCFEFTVDKHDNDNGNIGAVNVYCNAQDTKMTLDACVSEVKGLLELYPEEFAMVIITYQQQSGWNERKTDGTVNQTRNPAIWMKQLNNYWTNLQMPTGTKKALYHQGKTVEQARGSLFCIARPTSNGEDNYAVITPKIVTSWIGRDFTTIASTTYAPTIETPVVTDPNILVIHGWGALKDKWYARGFTECIYHRGNGWTQFTNALKNDAFKTAMGYNANRPGRPFDTASKKGDQITTLSSGSYSNVNKTTDLDLESNFYYSTVCQEHKEPQANAAWVQEWARVSSVTDVYTIKEASSNTSSDGKYVKWIESKTEKENDVVECLDKAINDDSGNVIYINSLCGYYITNDVPKSIYPNSLTDYNQKVDQYYTSITKAVDILIPAELSTMSSDAGMCGDIATFASDMNSYFLQKLKTKLTEDNRLAGSTGIILMDRVSNTGAGAEIPSIIIANNFAPNYNVSDPEVPTTDYVEGDTPASRDNGAVVWGEWED